MVGRYHLVTDFELSADPDTVWAALVEVGSWPSWWRWLKRVRVLAEGDADGVGGRFLNVVATPYRYRLAYVVDVVRVQKPRLIEVTSVGHLRGDGRYELTDANAHGTAFRFTWVVQTRRWWMWLLSPLLRPLFGRSHHRLMADFGEGLAFATGSELVRFSSRALSPHHPQFGRLPAS
jgi:hypothetical protein